MQSLSESEAPEGWDMPRLAGYLGDVPDVGRPVLDRTGLTGLYAFSLQFSRKDGDDRPIVFLALQEQLGLKLEAAKAPLDVVVIDHVERPSGIRLLDWDLRFHVSADHLLDFGLAHGANALLNHLASLEQQQRGDAAHVIAHGGAAVGVYIHLAHLRLAGVFGGNGVDRRSDLPARAAPFRPEIHQHRDIGPEDILIEARIGKS
jgi:hypothetical protein